MSDDANELIAGNLRAEIARRKRTQSDLVAIWGIKPMAVSRRLSGQTPISATEIHAAAEWLGVAVTVLMPEAITASTTQGA